LRSPEEIGLSAAKRAVSKLEARKPETGIYPVVFDERVSSSLIGHLLSAANGAAVARGTSWLLNSRGAVVLPDNLSIIENPHRPRLSGSRPFDAEGLETKIRKIVDNGVLCDWTTDLSSSRKLKLGSTGNATRGVASIPMPSNWNISLTQGSKTQSELLQDMGCGILVTSMIGSTINPNTGDYSRGASGFWVENGEIQYPISELTIAGNLIQMLKTIIPANDARQYISRVVPSLLIDGITIAGS
jgi:PmbA protein